MKVSTLMTQSVQPCSVHDNLQRAAQIMWEQDCGIVPVIDDDAHVVGMLTDRDVCMAGYTQGRSFSDIPVTTAMAQNVFAVGENDAVETAEQLMRDKKIRRLPVLDAQRKLRGILSLNDLARRSQFTHSRGDGLSSDSITETLAAISEPSAPPTARRAQGRN